MKINWRDKNFKISPNFTVGEACTLDQWNILYEPDDNIEASNILRTVNLMEKVRTIVGDKPIRVHCLIRPFAYNRLVGGAPQSLHLEGLACDFSVKGMKCDKVRDLLLPHLVKLQARMEDRPGSDWVHIDLGVVTISRYFKV